MDTDSSNLLAYIVIFVLLMFSAFFSAAETAYSSVNSIRIHSMADDGNEKAMKAVKVISGYDKFIATILICNNLVNIAISSIITVIVTKLTHNYIAAISTGISTLLVLTFGEVLPKSYAKRHAESFSMNTASALSVIMTALTPLSFLFLRLMKTIKRDSDSNEKPTITEQELIYMLDTIEEEGVLEEQEKELVQSALEFDDITAEDILTPRVNMVAIDIESSPEEILQLINEEGFSRIPVYSETVDHIVGIAHSRDILQAAVKNIHFDIKNIMVEPYFVHRTIRINRLLQEFQKRKIHLALVNDDYGGILGIVTMEDILEELVGEIYDERDEVIDDFTELKPDTFEVSGDMPVDEFFDEIDYHPSQIEEDDYDTMNGLAQDIIEHIPECGEKFTVGRLEGTVLEMDEQKIEKMKFVLNPVNNTDD